ncbi:hypothetical protein Hamer_G000426 [Homarus americanus]|uniref:Uncharacterized protein n=1 Tax=Homarus americanus TaxID=6706 RepID=A0A8J5NDF3_HOMAM|nr:hypothetical protein Hamer_G000426 [Homarus americanus]
MSTLTNSGGEGMILQNMETANISTLGINNPAFVDVLDDASDPTTPSSTTYTSTNIPQPVVNAPVSGSPPDGENTLKIPTEESKDISRLENDKEEGAHGLRVPVVDGKSNNQDARHTISTQVSLGS